jgi:hypothetical protein
LFNDRWYKRGDKAENNCGRDTRGTKLLASDEINLGKVVLKFQMK